MSRPRLLKAAPAAPLGAPLPASARAPLPAGATSTAAEDAGAREAAHAEARAQGREEGLAEVTALLAGARAEAARLRRDAEPALVALAVRIAERLVGRALPLAPDVVVHVAREAIEAAGEGAPLVLRVHPDDLPLVTAAGLGGAPGLSAAADPAVARGGCVVESTLGVVDARLSTQLAAVARALGVGGARP